MMQPQMIMSFIFKSFLFSTLVAGAVLLSACGHVKPSGATPIDPEVYALAQQDFNSAMGGWQQDHSGFLFNFGTDGPLSQDIRAMFSGQAKLRQPSNYEIVCTRCTDPVRCTLTVDIRFDHEPQTSLREYQLHKTGFFGLYSEKIVKDTPNVRRNLAQCKRDNAAKFTAYERQMEKTP